MIWRPVTEKIATLTEIQKNWSLKDLLDAHEALDLNIEADRFYHKQAEMKAARNAKKRTGY